MCQAVCFGWQLLRQADSRRFKRSSQPFSLAEAKGFLPGRPFAFSDTKGLSLVFPRDRVRSAFAGFSAGAVLERQNGTMRTFNMEGRKCAANMITTKSRPISVVE